MNWNRVSLAGNLTRDPESKSVPMTDGPRTVTKFCLAVNSRRGRGKSEKVLFMECEAWGRAAEVIRDHLRKGRSAFFEGRLEQDNWEDKTTGQKRSRIKFVVEQMQFTDAKDSSPGGTTQAPVNDPTPVNDEDIPF